MKFSEFFLTILRRRLLLITLLAAFVLFVSLLLWRSYSNRPKIVKGSEETAVPLTVVVPDGSYSTKKTYVVKRVSRDSLSPTIANTFVGDLYEVSPSDGVDEFAMKPIRIIYRLSKDLYFGGDYANVKLAYIPDPKQPIYRIFGGANMGFDDKGAYIEAHAFHTSIVGLIADVPEKQKLGLQLLVERSRTIEPVLLLIPDVDRGFLGFVNSSQATNFWIELFPTRTIMYYEYPLASTRSVSYMNSFRSFAQQNVPSYLLFEAEKLAMELVRLKNFEFDIVAHGVGAIIARLAVELHPEVKNVRSLILVSPPNRGTNVVNPLYYGALIYRKDSQVVANNFGIDRFVVDAMKSHLLYYLEALGPIYSEILTGSDLLKKLDKTVRKDVRYLVVVGNSPPASIDVTGTQLEIFYPELVKGKGDGVVSHESATIEGIEKIVLNGSFFDCYLDPTFHAKLKDFLAQTRVEIPSYREETYPERVPQAQQTERIVKPATETKSSTQVETKREESVQLRVSLPVRFERSQLLTKVGALDLKGARSIHFVLGRLFYVLEDGLYSDGKRIQSGTIRYVHVLNDSISFVANDRLYRFNGSKVTDLGRLDLAGVEDVLATDGGVFALLRSKENLVLARWENGWKQVQILSGVYGKFIDGPSLLVMTNREIYDFSIGNLRKLLDSSKIRIDGRSVDFKSCLMVSDLLFVGLRSYSLLVYDLRTETYTWGAEGWIDPETFLPLKNAVLIAGTSTIFTFDLQRMSLNPSYQSFSERMNAVTGDGEKLYVLTESSVEVYKLK
ncbi:hypothetical protein AS159_06145 [Thermotoga sp. Ku-13t]|uniref:alpha/beta hydrolase n=1 Tax=Thermotoga sp. Ku-13t TaxID=1755813 RepID=UPI0013EA5155|nr:alpha/beta hydrolase [Thermotoga sp. Ku-13t]KAF2957966.1 hypothetical protein AS159_06145 [Thermotoga sp. Ku-13t]